MIQGSEVLAWVTLGALLMKGFERASKKLIQWRQNKTAREAFRHSIEEARKRVANLYGSPDERMDRWR